MAGPPLFTQVFAFSIASANTLHLPGAPYFLAAILLTLSLVIAVFVARAHANSPAHVPLPPQEPEALS
jgi:DHA1 family tetracycline resistance protein-like MFS transporter